MELKTKIDQLLSEKMKLNEDYQKRLQNVLKEKEELQLDLAGKDDKIQKLELNRDQMRLRNQNDTSQMDKLREQNKEYQDRM